MSLVECRRLPLRIARSSCPRRPGATANRQGLGNSWPTVEELTARWETSSGGRFAPSAGKNEQGPTATAGSSALTQLDQCRLNKPSNKTISASRRRRQPGVEPSSGSAGSTAARCDSRGARTRRLLIRRRERRRDAAYADFRLMSTGSRRRSLDAQVGEARSPAESERERIAAAIETRSSSPRSMTR
jgi:hypothetical protein